VGSIIRSTDFIKTLNQAPIIWPNCELSEIASGAVSSENITSLTRKSATRRRPPGQDWRVHQAGFCHQGDGARTGSSAIATLSSSPVAARHGCSPFFACSPHSFLRKRSLLFIVSQLYFGEISGSL